MHINKEILITHYCYVESLLISMINDNKFMFIIEINTLLIKKVNLIDNDDISTIFYKRYQIWL